MSWGAELWDQFDNVNSYTHKGIDFCERYARFIKERCDIENEYAAKLKKLIKNFQPKKKEEDDFAYSCNQGFLNMINELHDMAGQHEMITENLNTNVLKELLSLVSELKSERKKHHHEYTRLQGTLQDQLLKLEKSKKQYEKSFKESEKSVEAYRKADADIHLSRAEVDKAKNLMINRQQFCEECKNEYALELQKTNEAQKVHYFTSLPQVFQSLENLDSKRISTIQQFITQSASIERNVLPILNTCIDGMQKAATSIDIDKDRQMVIDKYKSGFQPPVDIPFEDLSNGNFMETNSNANTPQQKLQKETIKGTMSGGKTKKRGGIFGIFGGSKIIGLLTDDTKEDYSHLPPTQQKKKLTQKIDTLRAAVAKETAEREGMLKMRDVYIQNTALGDPASLDKQLEENAQQLDKLKQELQKFEGYLSGCDNRNQQNEGLTRKMSSLSVSSSSQPSTPIQQHHEISQQPQDSQKEPPSPQMQEQESFEYSDDDEKIIGRCKVLYDFLGENPGSMDVHAEEELNIVESDSGDGWTRVQRGIDEGFVPTSYIQILEITYENQ